MPDVTVSADIDAFMIAANDAAARGELALTSLATTTPGTGVATALTQNIGSAGAPILFNGAGGTPSSMVGTNITGTAAGLTAGAASAVAVGGITGLGANVGAALAIAVGSAGGPVVNGGALGTSPSVTTSITTGSTTFALFNATATTVNAFGATTTLNIGASAATVLNFGGFTSAAELRFLEPSGSGTNYSGLKQPALAASITYLLPADAPANGDVLTSQTDGTLSWEPQSGAANAVTAASVAAGAGLFWTSGGADRTAVATDTVTTANITNANVTNFLPVSNDGAAIGASGTAFSDLFLASGAVINFNAGNYTLTHSAGVLTANLDFRVTTAGTNSASVVTVGGTQTLTNKSIPVTVKVTAANYTVGTTSALELYGGVIFVTSAATITIPAVVAGQSFTIITIGAIAVSADPDAADLIILDGTTLSDGDKITNLSTAGDIAVFTAYDATGWYASTNGWTDTN